MKHIKSTGAALLLWAVTGLAHGQFSDVLAMVKPAVVAIGIYTPTGRPQSRLLGTGFVVGDGRRVATNAHVLPKLDAEKRQRVVVISGKGGKGRVLTAKVMSVDSEHDLAVLSIDARLPAFRLAATDEVNEGEIFAFTGFPIGSVLGLYPVTHRGMLSSVTPIAIPAANSRSLDPAKIKRLENPVTVYQLDATAYPGNSGSPLYNMRTGEVVGILNQVYVKSTKEDVLSKPSGISFAVPVRHLRDMLANLP